MSPRTQCVMAPDRPGVRKNRGVHKLKLKNSDTKRERERENWWRTKTHEDPSHRTESQVIFIFLICSASTTTCPPPYRQQNVAQMGLLFLFFFYCFDFIRLMRDIVLCFQSFDYVLCFCSDCGMFYFVTVEIKKREWRTIEKMDERERIIILFNRW